MSELFRDQVGESKSPARIHDLGIIGYRPRHSLYVTFSAAWLVIVSGLVHVECGKVRLLSNLEGDRILLHSTLSGTYSSGLFVLQALGCLGQKPTLIYIKR